MDSAIDRNGNIDIQAFTTARRLRGYETAMEAPVPRPKLGVLHAASVLLPMLPIAVVVIHELGVPGRYGGPQAWLAWFGFSLFFAATVWRPYFGAPRTRLVVVVERNTLAKQHDVLEVTLAGEDLRRVTLRGPRALIGAMRDGDIGVASARANQLIGFHRLEA